MTDMLDWVFIDWRRALVESSRATTLLSSRSSTDVEVWRLLESDSVRRWRLLRIAERGGRGVKSSSLSASSALWG